MDTTEQQLETTTEAVEQVTETTVDAEAGESGQELSGEQQVKSTKTPVEPPVDWSFKFNDETKEVPEEFRWVKEKDKVEKLKEWYQANESVKLHKEQTGQLKQTIESYQSKVGEYEPIVNQVKQLQEWYGKGDHERVLTALGYDKDKILQLARQFIEAERMPPEQKQLYEQNRQALLAQEEIQKQNEYYKQVAAEQLATLTSMQLEAELGKADVSAVAKVYDQKFGAGKFRQLVISQGEAMVARLGRHVPPSELVPGIVQQFAPFVTAGGPALQTTSDGVGSEGSLKVSGGPEMSKPKVIPNVKGTSAAIGGKTISSIAELKQLRQTIGG